MDDKDCGGGPGRALEFKVDRLHGPPTWQRLDADGRRPGHYLCDNRSSETSRAAGEPRNWHEMPCGRPLLPSPPPGAPDSSAGCSSHDGAAASCRMVVGKLRRRCLLLLPPAARRLPKHLLPPPVSQCNGRHGALGSLHAAVPCHLPGSSRRRQQRRAEAVPALAAEGAKPGSRHASAAPRGVLGLKG